MVRGLVGCISSRDADSDDGCLNVPPSTLISQVSQTERRRERRNVLLPRRQASWTSRSMQDRPRRRRKREASSMSTGQAIISYRFSTPINIFSLEPTRVTLDTIFLQVTMASSCPGTQTLNQTKCMHDTAATPGPHPSIHFTYAENAKGLHTFVAVESPITELLGAAAVISA